MKPSPVMVYCPCRNADEARSIAKACIQEKLAACANIVPAVESIYVWDGVLQQDVEAVLWLKTLRHCVEPLERRIRELHSYKTPCIAVLAVESMNADYQTFVENSILSMS
jgi:periplasmic divalent cation tolerance protein